MFAVLAFESTSIFVRKSASYVIFKIRFLPFCSFSLYITSHCDGAFVLAKAGLLDHAVATTFPTDIDQMRKMFPHLDIRKDVLFVHDGKYITSAGGARSFEAALYLCEMLYGTEIAQRLAQGLVINWDLTQVPHLVVGSQAH